MVSPDHPQVVKSIYGENLSESELAIALIHCPACSAPPMTECGDSVEVYGEVYVRRITEVHYSRVGLLRCLAKYVRSTFETERIYVRKSYGVNEKHDGGDGEEVISNEYVGIDVLVDE